MQKDFDDEAGDEHEVVEQCRVAGSPTPCAPSITPEALPSTYRRQSPPSHWRSLEAEAPVESDVEEEVQPQNRL